MATGEAVAELLTGVLLPDVSFFLLRPFSWYRICGLGFDWLAERSLSVSRSVETDLEEAFPVPGRCSCEGSLEDGFADSLPFPPK